jgi:uncharacterized protein
MKNKKEIKKIQELAQQGDVEAQEKLGMHYVMEKEFRKAAFWFRKSVNKGGLRAQHGLATLYFFGLGVKQNYKKAVELFKGSAAGEIPKSQWRLGNCYRGGLGIKQNKKTGWEWIHKAAENGNMEAQHDLSAYYKSLALQEINIEKNLHESAKWCLMAAEQGCPSSQVKMSEKYLRGIGVKKNIRLARKWAKKSAKQGSSGGQSQFGVLLLESDPDQSFDLFKKSSEQGDERGIRNLASCHLHGIGTEKNYEEGLRWMKIYGEKSPDSMFGVGELFMKGESLKQDNKEALKWFIRAANQGVPEFQWAVGQLYTEGEIVEKNPKKEAEWYEKAARANHPLSQFQIGLAKISGRGVKKNEKEGVDWLKKSSKNGYPNASAVLGNIDYKKNNFEDAFKWYQLGADQGSRSAQINMAHLMQKGLGTKRNESEAFRLLILLSEKGYAEAQVQISSIYAFGVKEEQIDNKKAFFWAKKAVNQNNPRAQDLMGGYYELGIGVRKNIKVAFKYRMLAAEQGLDQAQYNIGVMYRDGTGVKRDLKKSFAWFEKAASQGYGDGELNLGYCYLNGIGTDMSYDKAYEWLKKSADKGMHNAQMGLGYLYAEGLAVKKDKKKALYWFEKASEANKEGIYLNMAHLCREEKKKMKGYLCKEVELIFNSTNFVEISSKLEYLINDDLKVWLGELVEQGETSAITLMGLLKLANSEQRVAFKFIKKAVGQNDFVAKFYLAMFYRYGRVVSKNLPKAKKLLGEVVNSINSNPLKNLEMAKSAMEQDQLSHFYEKYLHVGNKDLQGYEDRIRYESDVNYSSSLLVALERHAREIIASIDVLHEKDKTQKEVLSYLTHTINSAFGATQENLNQTIRIMKSEYEKGTPQYKAINNIVSLSSTFLVINNLVQTFKVYINDPRVFEDAWAKDNEGEGNQIKVLAFSVRLVIANILFQFPAHKVNGLARSKSGFNLKALRKDFINEILLLELNADNSNKILQWVEKNFNFSFKFGKNQLFRFEEYGIRFNFLMSIATEIILNSVKYSKPELPIKICWEYDLRQFVFKCSNFIDTDSKGKFLGAGRGLDFIKELVGNLGNSNLKVTDKAHEKFETILKIKNI